MSKNSAYAMIGAGLMCLVLNLGVIAPMATGAVQEAIDGMTVMTEETWEDEEWLNSTDRRSYYAYSVTNYDDVMNGSDPIFSPEPSGPYTYDIMTYKNVLSHHAESGTLTYNSSSVFTWDEDEPGNADPNTQITQLNILYEAQRVAAFPTMISLLGDIAGAGFMAQNLEHALTHTHAAIRVGEDLDAATAGYPDNGSAAIGNAAYQSWANASNHSGPAADFTDLSFAFYDAVDAEGVDISLCGSLGTTLFVGMGEPNAVTTAQRAAMYGFSDADDNVTSARDWALFSYLGVAYSAYGGGTEWTTATEEGLEQRMEAIFGISFENKDITNLLMKGDDTEEPLGLLSWSENEMMPGLAVFGQTAPSNPGWTFLEFGISLNQLTAIGEWLGGFTSGEAGFPMALLGGSGVLNSTDWWAEAWGGDDPINEENVQFGLNYFTILPWVDLTEVSLTTAEIDNVRDGPFGIHTSNSIYTLYGIYANRTVPVDADPLSPTYLQPMLGGEELPFTNEILGAMYGLDADETAMLRLYIENMFDGVLPIFLNTFFGVTKWSTHSVNEWLFGWHDPLLAYVMSDETDMDAAMADMTVGWASLESNQTYYGSPNVYKSVHNYTIYTGEVDLADVGEFVAYDDNHELWWRTTEHHQGTFGLSPIESMAGATGGWVDGTNYDTQNPPSFIINLADYAVVETTYEGQGTLHGMEVEVWSANVDPTQRSVQQKLIDSATIMDVFPGGLPIYFGSETTLMTESVTGRIVSGDSQSLFYLDTRGLGAENPTMADLQPVFVIERSAQMDAETAGMLQDKVHANQETFTYWMNFDTGADAFFIDYITAIFYFLGILLPILGTKNLLIVSEEEVDKMRLESSPGMMIEVGEVVEALEEE